MLQLMQMSLEERFKGTGQRSSPEEIVISIRLPSGKALQGYFLVNSQVNDLYDFVTYSFRENLQG